MEIAKYADQRFRNDCGGFDPAETPGAGARLEAAIEEIDNWIPREESVQ
jgi:hypothetical protein